MSITRPGSGWSPVRYNHGQPWDSDSAQELRNEVFLGRLLVDGHCGLKEILSSSADAAQIRNRLAREIRFTLQDREQHEPFNQLIRRVKRLADNGAFERHKPKRQPEWLSLPGVSVEYRQLRPDEVLECVRACQDLPVVYSRRALGTVQVNDAGNDLRQQGSRMYDTHDLQTAVERILRVAGCINYGQLREIFSWLLTPWSVKPAVTYNETVQRDDLADDDLTVAPDDDVPDELDQPMSIFTTERIEIEFPELADLLRQLGQDDTYFLLCHGSGQTDVAIAQQLNIVRQTAAKRRREVLARVSEVFDPSNDAESAARVLRMLAIERLADFYVQNLSDTERRLWMYVTQGAADSAAALCEAHELDTAASSGHLIAKFNEDVLTALRSDDPERLRYEHRVAIEASLASAAERTSA